MLYDTLLPTGEYRLGVRYANPSDTVRQPPFLGVEARNVISTRYADEEVAIELGLEPLNEVGTRVIVPQLSQEAVKAVQSGELYEWLQRCWWRAVQAGLTIDIVDEHGAKRTVDVPSWWQAEPWKQPVPGVGVYEDIDVADDLKIKRIVVLYDESLVEPDIGDFWGVQLLRGQQWIDTLGPADLSDCIPKDRRLGFRGFVEFDKGTERTLRRAENPQHEDRRVEVEARGPGGAQGEGDGFDRIHSVLRK